MKSSKVNSKKTNNLIKNKWTENLKRYLTKEDIHLGNKHLKRCSTLYNIIREMQIKISRFHYIPIKMATNWNNNNTKCWWGFGTTGILIHLLMRRQNGTAPLKENLAGFYSTKYLTIQPSNCTPWYLPKGVENLYTQ